MPARLQHPAEPPYRHAPVRRRRLLAVTTRRSVFLGAGLVLILAGVASVPSPLPIGFVLFSVGLYFVARGSRTARRSVKWMRRRSPLFSRHLNRVKHRLPTRMKRFVESSDPHP